MTEEPVFPLYSVWQRVYTSDHWVVFCICEIDYSAAIDVGCRVALILAKQDPRKQTGMDALEKFRFDPFSPFASHCERVA